MAPAVGGRRDPGEANRRRWLPRPGPRAGRRERMVLGTYLLACSMAVISMLVGETFTSPSRTVGPSPALAREILLLAGLTLAAALALSCRFFGLADGTRLILSEAWPGLLTGAALGFITGAALRAVVSDDAFWFVLAPLYVAGIVAIRWFARRAPADELG